METIIRTVLLLHLSFTDTVTPHWHGLCPRIRAPVSLAGARSAQVVITLQKIRGPEKLKASPTCQMPTWRINVFGRAQELCESRSSRPGLPIPIGL